MTCDVAMWTQNDLKSQKVVYLSQLFLHKTETLYSCYTHHKVHCNISMATQWAPGPLHLKGKISFLPSRSVICSCCSFRGCERYGHYTTQAQGSRLNLGAKVKAFFISGRQRSVYEYVAMVTSCNHFHNV